MTQMREMLDSLILKSHQDEKRMVKLEMREKKRLDEEQHQRQVATHKTRNDKVKTNEPEVVTYHNLPKLENDSILTRDNMKRFWELQGRVRKERDAREARRRFFEE